MRNASADRLNGRGHDNLDRLALVLGGSPVSMFQKLKKGHGRRRSLITKAAIEREPNGFPPSECELGSGAHENLIKAVDTVLQQVPVVFRQIRFRPVYQVAQLSRDDLPDVLFRNGSLGPLKSELRE